MLKKYLNENVEFYGDVFGVDVGIFKGIIKCHDKEFTDPDDVVNYIVNDRKITVFANRQGLHLDMYNRLSIVDVLYYSTKDKVYGIRNTSELSSCIFEISSDKIKEIADIKMVKELIKKRKKFQEYVNKRETELDIADGAMFRELSVLKVGKK